MNIMRIGDGLQREKTNSYLPLIVRFNERQPEETKYGINLFLSPTPIKIQGLKNRLG